MQASLLSSISPRHYALEIYNIFYIRLCILQSRPLGENACEYIPFAPLANAIDLLPTFSLCESPLEHSRLNGRPFHLYGNGLELDTAHSRLRAQPSNLIVSPQLLYFQV
jgi:hypothetical protein